MRMEGLTPPTPPVLSMLDIAIFVKRLAEREVNRKTVWHLDFGSGKPERTVGAVIAQRFTVGEVLDSHGYTFAGADAFLINQADDFPAEMRFYRLYVQCVFAVYSLNLAFPGRFVI